MGGKWYNGLAFTLETQAFIPNSGTRMLSSLLQLFLGMFFLFHNVALTASLPPIFAESAKKTARLPARLLITSQKDSFLLSYQNGVAGHTGSALVSNTAQKKPVSLPAFSVLFQPL